MSFRKGIFISTLFSLLVASLNGLAQNECYSVTEIPFAPEVVNSSSSVQLSDDEFSDAIPIGFSFCFYGINYDLLLIGSNGIISFDTSLATTNCAFNLTEPVPSSAEVDALNAILGPWQDLNPGAGGSINYSSQGIAPYRKFVINYNAVSMYACTDSVSTSQIVLYEGNNAIDISIETKFYCAAHNEGAAILGIQDASGTEAYWANDWNYTQWEATDVAYRFTPTCYCEKEAAPNQVLGKVYLVNDQDCIPHPGELGIPNASVSIQPEGALVWTDSNGDYSAMTSNGEFEVSQNPIAGMDQVCPFSITYQFDTTNAGAFLSNVNFGNVVDQECADLTVSMGNNGIGNCESNTHAVEYCNTGNVAIQNVQVALEMSEYSGVTGSSIPFTILGGGSNVTFDIGTLGPFECGNFSFTDTIACGFGAGNVICYNLVILPNSGADCNASNNSYLNCQTTQATLAPNNKMVRDLQDLENGLVQNTEWTLVPDFPYAEYIIRFQNNTGVTQENVWITDPISDHLDIGSLQQSVSSHPYQLSYSNGILRFNFYGINLPSATESEEASKGFVQYRIKLDSSVTDQVSIPNTAMIHFGENSTESTNPATINIQPNSIKENSMLDFALSPNPTTGIIQISAPANAQIEILDLSGKVVISDIANSGGIMDVGSLSSGAYFVRIEVDKKFGIRKLIKQ